MGAVMASTMARAMATDRAIYCRIPWNYPGGTKDLLAYYYLGPIIYYHSCTERAMNESESHMMIINA